MGKRRLSSVCLDTNSSDIVSEEINRNEHFHFPVSIFLSVCVRVQQKQLKCYDMCFFWKRFVLVPNAGTPAAQLAVRHGVLKKIKREASKSRAEGC